MLYPVGILLGEMPLYYAGLPYLRERRLHSVSLPNALNFSFDYHRAAQVGAHGRACHQFHLQSEWQSWSSLTV